MKNIDTILEEAGVELSDEQKKAITDGVKENYKPVADWQKQVDKVKSLETSLTETQDALKKFDNVDAEALNKKIEELNATIEENKANFDKKMAERDFADIIDKAIADAKGKNAKAISALLDMDALRTSKNQKDDIEKALATLAQAEDSKMLFGEKEPEKAGTGTPIGTVQKQQAQPEATLAGALAAHYTQS